jgi:excisionase family DNA binding protein
MNAARRSGRTITAVQLARYCGVDLKTIHNWTARGKIPHWRTPGRQLRFRRLDVVDFLRAYEFELPDALRQARPRVAVIESDAAMLAWVRRLLGRRFELVTYDHVVEGLLALVTTDPEVLVLGDVSPIDARTITRSLAADPAMQHVRVVTLGPDVEGATASVPRADGGRLREAMERVTGVEY